MSESSNRPSWNQYFKDIVEITATRSPCHRLHVGCLLVKDNELFRKDIMDFCLAVHMRVL